MLHIPLYSVFLHILSDNHDTCVPKLVCYPAPWHVINPMPFDVGVHQTLGQCMRHTYGRHDARPVITSRVCVCVCLCVCESQLLLSVFV